MASVIVYSAERMKQIEDTTVIAGTIVVDDLVLTRRDGITIAAGNVRGAQGLKGDPGGLDDASLQLASPIGSVIGFAGASAPTNWLICDGASYLRSNFANLFNVIGATFGSVDSTHFNVPDFRQRFPMGKAGAAPGNVLGGVGGTKDAVVAAHTHSHTHTLSTDGSHKHAADGDPGLRWLITYPSATTQYLVDNSATHLAAAVAITDIDTDGSHNHGGATGTNAVSSGVDGTNQNLPPFVVLNYIIRY